MAVSVSHRADQSASHPKLAHTMRELGHLIGCCERQVWGYIKDGHLKAVRLKRSVRIMHVELVWFLESRQD